MYAVLESGGKQYRVEKGQILSLEKLNEEVGAELKFDQLLLVADENNVKVGAPYVSNAAVTAVVKEHGRGKKIKIIKHKRRKYHMKSMGHRQSYTKIEITGIA